MSDAGYTPQGLGPRVRRAVRARGVRPVAGDFARWGMGALAGAPWTLAGSHGAFDFQGARYAYRFDRYKLTWLTERAVEVPVMQALVDRYAGRRVLEIGNVLSHYRPQSHLVLDKYERRSGVLNRDVLELDGLGRFDLIVAISTLEHVGWDEHPRDPGKAMRALLALRALLAPGGRLAISHPVGYNPVLDAALRDGALPITTSAALRRLPGTRRWREVPVAEVFSAPYDFLLYSARGVFFALLEPAPG